MEGPMNRPSTCLPRFCRSVRRPSANEPVTVTVTNPPGWSNDWLALARVGSPATDYVAFVYLNNSAPTWTVNMPATEGAYEFRLLLDNSYIQAGVSPPVLVE